MTGPGTLRSIPLFSHLREQDVARIGHFARERSYPKNSVIVFEEDPGDSLYVVMSGQVKVVLIGEDGREVILSTPSRGDFFAAALATGYCLARRELSPERKVDWRCWLAAVGAVGVGVMRMAAAKHYPSDVLSGWAAGVGTAFVVHAVKF